MANTIRLRRGTGAPTASLFQIGEPAWDAANGVLYVKNNAGSMVQVGATSFLAGSATSPGVAVGSGTTYSPGIYSPGTDALAIATGGVQRVKVDSTGLTLPGATSGNITLAATAVAGTTTLTLPATTGTVVTTGDTGTVTSTMIADGTIANADISTTAGIDFSKLAALTSANILLGNASNVATSTALSGDVSITNAGVTTVVSGSTSTAGKLQLTNATNSTSTTTAATPNSVKSAYDLANAAVPKTSIWTVVDKVNDESRTSNTTLTADSALAFSMAASTKYMIRVELWFNTGATGDFKVGFTGPAIGTGIIAMTREHIVVAATALSSISVATAYDTTGVAVTSTSGGTGYVRMSGLVQNGANAGNFQITWAQNTPDTTATIVRAGSRLEYMIPV